MRYRTIAVFVVSIVLALALPAGALAFGGPNSAGNSGHFHPNSNPCVSDNDHPNCPGPH